MTILNEANIRNLIYKHSDQETLLALSQIGSKDLYNEIKALSGRLHAHATTPHALPEQDVAPALRYLDSLAGLLWFAATPPGKTKGKSTGGASAWQQPWWLQARARARKKGS